MTAGRSGSWESALLLDVIYFGNGLNLIPDAPDSEEHRASGPNG